MFYLKEALEMVRSDQSSLWKFMDSVMKNDNWSQEMHVIMPHIEFEHIKGKDNV